VSIRKEIYLELRKKYGDVASWAIWSKPVKAPKDRVGDLSIFDSPDLLKQLTGEYMFVALCGSGVHEKFIDRSIAWWNFHSSNPNGQDYKLRDATVGTPTEGGYITDFIKYHDELDAKKAVKFVETHPELLHKNIDALYEEIDLLGMPILIALGNDSYNLIKKYLPGYSAVFKIHHYAATVREGQMKEEILSGIKQIKQIIKTNTERFVWHAGDTTLTVDGKKGRFVNGVFVELP